MPAGRAGAHRPALRRCANRWRSPAASLPAPSSPRISRGDPSDHLELAPLHILIDLVATITLANPHCGLIASRWRPPTIDAASSIRRTRSSSASMTGRLGGDEAHHHRRAFAQEPDWFETPRLGRGRPTRPGRCRRAEVEYLLCDRLNDPSHIHDDRKFPRQMWRAVTTSSGIPSRIEIRDQSALEDVGDRDALRPRTWPPQAGSDTDTTHIGKSNWMSRAPATIASATSPRSISIACATNSSSDA